MTGRWLAALIRAYPPGWRRRFGRELETLVEDLAGDGRPPLSVALNILRGAAAAWLTDRRTALPDRTTALLAVLWSWVCFAATAAWFGKNAGEYPSAALAQSVGNTHPGLAITTDLLLVAGIIGIVITLVAAVPFAVASVRRAVAERSRATLALIATPPTTVIVWLAGLKLANTAAAGSTTRFVAVSVWLLAGVLGIAASTLAVGKVVARGGYPDWTWRVGLAAAAAVTVVMAAGAGATFAWGLAARPVRPGPDGGAIGWIIVVASMMLTTLRAVWALASLRGRRRATAA
ncbi:hypothetical protein KGA66_19230 [Actinocrinis puniceicyclus]|uniref:Uncharacterized protein n=1 Tax=Actinocrinis puniceicyclus TaxID=977794 RepID=A0A8J7WMP6_9ACTN|nr:hypothetical protein [Actinocrinis puniceicyclus]MBS2965191.1 hypothetical protein [Actinocrinis puniceicyclus]